MRKKQWLRPGDLAKDVGLSVQTIRNYEQLGFLPAAERGPQGYRRYTAQHLHALRVARLLIRGFGWECTRRIMEAIHQGKHNLAWAEIDARHSGLDRSRRQVEETLRLLQATANILEPLDNVGDRLKPQYGLHVGEAARHVGVRVSAVRFWEERGLLQPLRDASNHYRLYNAEQLRNLQVTALLRKANYDMEAIRTVLQQLAQGTPEQALAVAENQLKALAETSRCCVDATAALWGYVQGGAQ